MKPTYPELLEAFILCHKGMEEGKDNLSDSELEIIEEAVKRLRKSEDFPKE